MSCRPDQASVRRQQPACGRSIVDGPGPPDTTRLTGLPRRCGPAIHCALMCRSESESCGRRATHSSLLLIVLEGGEKSFPENEIATISPRRPSARGRCGRLSENPARAHAGIRPNVSIDPHALAPAAGTRTACACPVGGGKASVPQATSAAKYLRRRLDIDSYYTTQARWGSASSQRCASARSSSSRLPA